jgi:hypothetical protein
MHCESSAPKSQNTAADDRCVHLGLKPGRIHGTRNGA